MKKNKLTSGIRKCQQKFQDADSTEPATVADDEGESNVVADLYATCLSVEEKLMANSVSVLQSHRRKKTMLTKTWQIKGSYGDIYQRIGITKEELMDAFQFLFREVWDKFLLDIATDQLRIYEIGCVTLSLNVGGCSSKIQLNSAAMLDQVC